MGKKIGGKTVYFGTDARAALKKFHDLTDSPNILKALEVARERGVKTVGFTGEKGRQSMAPKCDLCLVVPS